MQDEWLVYIVECRTKELYVGISKNIQERIERHNKGLACRYTKFRRPVTLVYYERCEGYSHARTREREIKKYSRIKKLKLRYSVKDPSPPIQG